METAGTGLIPSPRRGIDPRMDQELNTYYAI